MGARTWLPPVLVLAGLVAGCRSAAPSNGGGAAGGDVVLVVASDLANPPFAELTDDGEARGRDVEMMEWIAAELGRALEWRRLPFDALLDAARAGEVDAVCSTLGVTAERARTVRFSRPYFATRLAVVVRAGADEPRVLADLAGRRVAAGAGTTSQDAVLARLPDAVGVLENKQELPAAERLAARRVDAVVMDGPAAEALVADARGALRVLDEDLGAELYAIVFPPDRDELRVAVDRALELLAAQGGLEELDTRWGLRSAPLPR